MKTFSLLIVALMLLAQPVLAWGGKGHAIITCIAENHLTPKAKETIESYLSGKSIIYYASWMDFYRHTSQYEFTSEWHEAPCNKDFYHTDTIALKEGDAVTSLKAALDSLSHYRQLNDSTVAANIRYVIHLMADLHCPCHVIYPGVNQSYTVNMYNMHMKYHDVWDSFIIEYYRTWSYTEWQQNIDRVSDAEARNIVKGGVDDWFHDTAVYCQHIYDMAPPNATLDKNQTFDFLNSAILITEHQLINAGYRLAYVLNNIFGE